MRFESVTAHAFGAIADRALELAPGMTVVCGPNEAGKSTWHDAIFAGLCGRRRGQGRTKDDRLFEERRRPWRGDAWDVAVTLRLDDGRRIEIRQDLDAASGRATDLDLGHDVTRDIVNEGCPDGARWLGLDRRTLPAVACVRQAEVLAVIEQPELLQEHLQRAAATAGPDATTAEAIVRIERYRAEQVGMDRAGTRKPLRAARERLEQAERALAGARSAHEEFLRLGAEARQAAVEAGRARASLLAARAAESTRLAADSARKLRRARELAARFPDGPPGPADARDAQAQEAAAALGAWEGRPDAPPPVGRSAAELRAELAALPDPPRGDTAVHPEVQRAAETLRDARRAVELHGAERPPGPAGPVAGGAAPEALLELARDLEASAPDADPALSRRAAESARLRASLQMRRRAGVAGGAILGAAGGLAAWLWQIPAGLGAILAGAAFMVWSVLYVSGRLRRVKEAQRSDELNLAAARIEEDRAAGRRSAAEARARALGAGTTPEELRALARAAAGAAEARRRLETWIARQEALRGSADAAEQDLAGTLRARGAAVEGGADEAFSRYAASCSSRACVAAQASRRGDLEKGLADREAAERAAAESAARLRAAREALDRAAARCGVAGGDDAALASGLRHWLQERRAELRANEQAAREHAELRTILGDGTLADLEAAAADLQEAAAGAWRSAGVDPVEAADGEADPVLLEEAARRSAEEASVLAGRAAERAATLACVPEAEEALAAARAELDRIERLARTLDAARGFLERAQDRVHRDIAPRLAATVRRWLPGLTGGRYVDATVDPATLAVRVRDAAAHWRDARHLSHGTSEQVYLLLRLALAEHLTARGETCPLVLDDVTVQSDAQRTLALLAMLRQVSAERQVILFSQEPEVLEWAEADLEPPQNMLVRLEPLPVGA